MFKAILIKHGNDQLTEIELAKCSARHMQPHCQNAESSLCSLLLALSLDKAFFKSSLWDGLTSPRNQPGVRAWGFSS